MENYESDKIRTFIENTKNSAGRLTIIFSHQGSLLLAVETFVFIVFKIFHPIWGESEALRANFIVVFMHEYHFVLLLLTFWTHLLDYFPASVFVIKSLLRYSALMFFYPLCWCLKSIYYC